MNLQEDVYSGINVTILLHMNNEKIPLKGVTQGDTISPKLYRKTLESRINGEYLNNSRFTDDSFSETEQQQQMTEELHMKVGLKMIK